MARQYSTAARRSGVYAVAPKHWHTTILTVPADPAQAQPLDIAAFTREEWAHSYGHMQERSLQWGEPVRLVIRECARTSCEVLLGN